MTTPPSWKQWLSSFATLAILAAYMGLYSTPALAQPKPETMPKPITPVATPVSPATPSPSTPAPLPSTGMATSPQTASDIPHGQFFKDAKTYQFSTVVDTLIPAVATRFAQVLAVLGLVFLFYAAFEFLTAEGEEEKISHAIRTAVYVVLGLVLAMFAYAIVYLLLSILTPTP